MALKQPSTVLEERLNTYSHALGVVFALYGLLYFTRTPWMNGYRLPIFIYGGSLLFLFAASTGYHAARNPRIKKRLRVLDHISIYFLIAGTYTPICTTILKDSKGDLLLIIVWAIATFGTVLKLFFTGKFEAFSLVLYGIMGWLVVIDWPFLHENLSETELFYLGLGGFFYTAGMVFYAVKKIPYNHFIWHLFVLGGAICHWFLIEGISVPL